MVVVLVQTVTRAWDLGRHVAAPIGRLCAGYCVLDPYTRVGVTAQSKHRDTSPDGGELEIIDVEVPEQDEQVDVKVIVTVTSIIKLG